MYPTRHFRLRCAAGFSPGDIAIVERGLEQWRLWVAERIGTWDESERALQAINPRRVRLPRPDYEIGPLALSADGTVLSVAIGGEPHTYGAIKVFEDGVPSAFYVALPEPVRAGLECQY